MSTFAKNLFSFAKNNEQDINSKLNKIDTLVKQIERQKHHEMHNKVRQIMNLAFDPQNGVGKGMIELLYQNCMSESVIEWVPVMGRVLNLLGGNSPFMRLILEAQDYKVPIQKHYIPTFVFRNNLLNEKSLYHNVSSSVSGLIVPLLDYVLIRLLNALNQSKFLLPNEKELNDQYESDDLFFYITRNPYLLLLKSYMDCLDHGPKNMNRLAGNIKMFFVDQLLLKHRINKSTSFIKELSFVTARYKLKPQSLLVIYLLLQKDRAYFEEKNLFLYEIVEKFHSLIDNENQIFFRFLFRVFLFAYSKNSVENKVIDLLKKANPVDGYFELKRYSLTEFDRTIGGSERKQRHQYNDIKPLLLKLLEKQQNLGTYYKINFSLIRTLGAFLIHEINMNAGNRIDPNVEKTSQALRINSEASSIQIGFQKIYRAIKSFLKKQPQKKSRDFSQQNEKKLMEEIYEIVRLYEKAYNRKIDLKKFDDLKQSTFDRRFNVRGINEDFTLSVESYKKQIEDNCWKVPLKDSEFQILYDIFYALAKAIDRVIPGRKQGSQPRINLRYFSNPYVFMITFAILIILMKVFF